MSEDNKIVFWGTQNPNFTSEMNWDPLSSPFGLIVQHPIKPRLQPLNLNPHASTTELTPRNPVIDNVVTLETVSPISRPRPCPLQLELMERPLAPFLPQTTPSSPPPLAPLLPRTTPSSPSSPWWLSFRPVTQPPTPNSTQSPVSPFLSSFDLNISSSLPRGG